ncbi:peptidylprolyl isomerase [Adhaeretor mobilis]|uniref:Peptidylprolyl isomerase n=1 Tax=Adhaeretor mobilis TaxID=1930276 RepID=A0A517MRG5_9BACT|nr:peptidylprolyl isomerase [Adhaeretor mobilis]QDS97465.1 peptidylprolyl isomerase [Adhaeretor mobilis]
MTTRVGTSVKPQAGVITPTPVGTAQPVEGGQIIARIDGQVVLASDLLWQVNQIVELNRDRIPDEELDTVRQMLLEKQLVSTIDTKLLYADFVGTIPAENLPKVKTSLAKAFEEHEVPRLIKMMKVKDQTELEAKITSYGGSMKDIQQQFFERSIAGEWLRQRTPKPKEVTHEQMLTYYNQHTTDFEFPTQARWEEVMVRFDRFNGDREAAWRALAKMGNDIWQQVAANPNLRGPVFTAVAQDRSQGFTAKDGGIHEWTVIGDLKCEDINKALANLEVGQMSDPIVSSRGFHLVRVIERKQAGRTPFTEAQTSIRKTLEDKQKSGLAMAEMEKMRKQAQVWTHFHGELPTARLTELLDARQRR